MFKYLTNALTKPEDSNGFALTALMFSALPMFPESSGQQHLQVVDPLP
jgi:hypothetical protein